MNTTVNVLSIMESPVKMDNNGSTKKSRKYLGHQAKEIVLNVFDNLKQSMSQIEALSRCESMTGVSSSTIYRIVREKSRTGKVQDPQLHSGGRKPIALDEEGRMAIRRTVYSFYLNNEIPTVDTILFKIKEIEIIPRMGRETLRKTLHNLDFVYAKLNQKSALIEKAEIISSRRKYLHTISDFRKQNKKIYYLDETGVNVGRASYERMPTGLPTPVDEGQRLIVLHIGSDSGFLDGSCQIFVSKNNRNYLEDLNSDLFEHWFGTVLQRVENNSVIVMDDASFHSRYLDNFPTTSSRKAEIHKWLREHKIPFSNTAVKAELLSIISQQSTSSMQYVIDEMACKHGVTILRLPPYHYHLNPIELIWVQTKRYVAFLNDTFKVDDVKRLLNTSLEEVTHYTWRNAINHVLKEEEQMWQLDFQIEKLFEPNTLPVSDLSGSDSDSSMDSMIKIEEHFVDNMIKVEEGFVKMEDNMVKVEDVFVEMEDHMVKVEDAFVKMEDNMVNIEDAFVKLEDNIVNMEDAFVKMEDVFEKMDNNMVKVEDVFGKNGG